MADIRDRNINARGSYDPRFDRVRPAAKKAQDAAKSQEKQGGNTKSNPLSQQEGPEVYRYPREALSDTTDALFISIFDQIRTSEMFGIKNTVKTLIVPEGSKNEGKTKIDKIIASTCY